MLLLLCSIFRNSTCQFTSLSVPTSDSWQRTPRPPQPPTSPLYDPSPCCCCCLYFTRLYIFYFCSYTILLFAFELIKLLFYLKQTNKQTN